MGQQDVHAQQQHARFSRALLADLRALELMVSAGCFETGVHRVGAEQEMFLIDRGMGPAPIALEVLAALDDPRFTTELARFNLEANLTPRRFHGSCLRDLHGEIEELLAKTRSAAHLCGADVALAGILPTLTKSHVGLDNMTPMPRYRELNRIMVAERGGRFLVYIRGVDELKTTHDNVMLESCNTSFQVHYQVDPAAFPRYYNAAQLITAPVLACAVNSPILLGRRLWAETRISLFESAVDARSSAHQARGHRPRVHFGDDWVRRSVIEVFRDDVARFRSVLSCDLDEDPEQILARGQLPQLRALRLHNSTIYRWNRPCYGVAEGVCHLRIENRVLPSGPTPVDEVANAAFFWGLLTMMAEEHPDLPALMSFDEAKANFFAAARHGLDAQLAWLDGAPHPAPTLILDELLPRARAGLHAAELDAEDIDAYLGVIEQRVRSKQTGARWLLRSLHAMHGEGTVEMRTRSVTAAMVANQRTDTPVHGWPLASLHGEPEEWRDSVRTVEQIMSTDLFTVRPDDLVELAASLMDWARIRHIPVETEDGRLIGLVSYWSMIRAVARGDTLAAGDRPQTVEEIMRRDLVTVSARTLTLDAIELMQARRVSCLPVVDDDRLIGIVTERDLVRVARELLRDYLRPTRP